MSDSPVVMPNLLSFKPDSGHLRTEALLAGELHPMNPAAELPSSK